MLPLLLALTTLLAQPATARHEQRTFAAPDGTILRYGLAVPADYDHSRPRPLVLALHPGGGGARYYGDSFLRSIFMPSLRELAPIMIAPDAPGRSWVEPPTERAVLALVDSMLREFAIDRQRVLVAGFSMGGAGTWFFSSRHPDRFTGAIVMAGRTDEPLAALAQVPTYVIHGREDEVVPFAQAEVRVAALAKMGRVVKFEALEGATHYAMGSYATALTRAGRWLEEQFAGAAGSAAR